MKIENLDNEIWMDIPNYEGLYKVSNMGRIYSIEREIFCGPNNSARRLIGGKLLKAGMTSQKYLLVVLSKNGKNTSILVHKLVAIVFLNHQPSGYNIIVDHIDNDKTNNIITNLQLISHRLNSSKDIVGATSKFTGVTWDKRANKWRSHLKINNKNIYLGTFINDEDAANRYNLALLHINKCNGIAKEFREYLNKIY